MTTVADIEAPVAETTDAVSATSVASRPEPRQFQGLTVPAPGVFTIDPSHTYIGFVARHMMVSKVRGSFTSHEGQIVIAENPLESSVEVTIDPQSVDTRDETRDNHLRSPDFFEVENHPSITFKSTGLSLDGGRLSLSGDLTIKGVTKQVTLVGEFQGVSNDPWGNERIGFSAETEIDRSDFGVSFNALLETGGMVVSNKVKLELEVEAVRQS
jgi:polyisoprenoid-binding protein YceI